MPENALADVDAIMEEAGAALAQMDYLTCEALCLQALAEARLQKNWGAYGRILMPLQETRRQRRMIAADGVMRFGTASLGGPPSQWLDELSNVKPGSTGGAFIVTHPHSESIAAELAELAQKRRQYVEVLFADNGADEPVWTLRSIAGPAISCQIKAPPSDWIDVWVDGEALEGGDNAMPSDQSANSNQADEPADEPGSIKLTPGAWLIAATEQLGNVAMDQATAKTKQDAGSAISTPDEALIETLEQSLRVVSDHELLHQRLSQVVKAVRLAHQ